MYGRAVLPLLIGIGTDLTEIDRIASILAGSAGRRFLARILTPAEQKIMSSRGKRTVEYAAGRFAAKEAVTKAFGCGIGRQIGFQDIEIVVDSTGKPVCLVAPEALKRLGFEQKQITVHISITHTSTAAGAFAVVEQVDK